MLIDTHTHIYLSEFSEDLNLMMQRAEQAGVTRMYLPNIDQESVTAMLELVAQYPERCFPMMGVHPCSVKPQTWEQELEQAYELLCSGTYYGVGEIGLDLYWDKSTIEIQQEAFRTQCAWAVEKNLPVSIHSRDATAECIQIVKDFNNKGLKGVFHCFSGTAEQANEIVKQGFLLGIGGVVTFKTSTLPELLKQVPIENIVLETDAPYLAPVPYRGKRNEPAFLQEIAAKLSLIYEIPVTQIAEITSTNALKLFHHDA